MSRIPISKKNRIRGESRDRSQADRNLAANNSAQLAALEETLTAVDVALANDIQTVSDDLDALELVVINVDGDLTALTTRVGIAETDIDDLESGLINTNTNVSNLDIRLGTAETDIGTNTTSIGTNATAISDEVTRATGVESGLQIELDDTQIGAGLGIDGTYTADVTTNYLTLASSLKDADKKLDAQVKVNADNISTNASGISTNAADIGTLQTDLTTTNTNVTNLTTDVTNLTTRVTTAESDIDNLESGLGTTNTNLTNLTTRVSTSETDITNLEAGLGTTNTNVTNLDTRLTTAEGSLSTAQTDITTLENDLASTDTRLTDAIALVETDRTTIVPQAGGGTLTALRENEIYDGGTYFLPLANSVLENQTIIITLPDEFRDFTPTVIASGGDAIFYSGRSTTADVYGSRILFDTKKLQSITLTSDGNTFWSL